MICSLCNLDKSLLDFYKRQSKCKECVKLKAREYSKENKESISKNKKRYYIENSREILFYKQEHYLNNVDKYKEKNGLYHKDNKEKLNKQSREYFQKNKLDIYQKVKTRKENDLLFKLSGILRKRTYNFIKSKKFNKKQGLYTYLGCDLETLKKHLEKLFHTNMTWDNYGYYGWHIDHIIPLASANNEEEMYKLCHYSNLQPLWANDNFTKGAK